MTIENAKSIFSQDLYEQYKWFQDAILPKVQKSSDDFFLDVFRFKLVAVSENINILSTGNSYFVTKIGIDDQHDIHVRTSDSAISIILNSILGDNDKMMDLDKLTDLEVKILTEFNRYMYHQIAPFILMPREEKRKNYDVINLTFFMQEKETEKSAKVVISLPKILLRPKMLEAQEAIFVTEDFLKSTINANISVGSTKFAVCDLKALEKGDLVILENSNLQKMTLKYDDLECDFRIKPNPSLIESFDEEGEEDYEEDNDGGEDMAKSSFGNDVWDKIQVEMGAEFDKIKMSLGELKNIQEGLVIDVSSVYNSKISLKVDNKTVAKGELVIINDRYGVKINEVITPDRSQPEEETTVGQTDEDDDFEPTPMSDEEGEGDELEQTQSSGEGDEEFDYSDFELDDEDI